jgi:hypothetical protein
MDKQFDTSATQELTPVKPRGPDDTLEPGPRSTDTQPFIPLSKRHPLEPGDETVADALVEHLRFDDPEFMREVQDAFQGTFSTFDVEILKWRHVTGDKFLFTAKVDGKDRELIVERQTKPRL